MSEVTSIIEVLSRSNSPALLITIAAGFSAFVIKEYFRALIRLREFRGKTSSKPTGGTEGEQSDEFLNAADAITKAEPRTIVNFNFRLLERYYEQHIIEYKLMSRSTLVISTLGFIIIAIGIFLAFADKTSVGVLTSIAGIVAEAVAVLFFRQNKVLMDQVMEYHKKLVSTQYLLTSIALAQDLPGSYGETEVKRIIGNLLYLSNVLHEAESDHLFDNSN